MADKIEYRLEKVQQRTVQALGEAQARLIQEQKEVQKALDALAERYAADFGHEDGRAKFEMRGDQVVLVVMPKPEAEAEPEAEASEEE